ncbi:MAG: tetratricopeptide repeat protein [Deltaproteobacteria bacterium]|nr:tetratricopeptide repeat protein [Deltaproteobacteria bacterium]
MRDRRDVDREFAQLAAIPEELIDLGRATLLVARDLDSTCDIAASLALLDEMAAPLSGQAARELPPERAAALLKEHVFERLGFCGNDEDYFDPRNSLLHEVLSRRTGIPITLGIAALEIARRAGIAAFGIGFPGHFLVGVGKRDRCILIDPFHGGRRLNAHTLTELLRGVAGPDARVLPEHLRPAGKRAIIMRLLANLKGVYVRRREGLNLLCVLDRLIGLEPGASKEVRDRGLVYADLGCFGPARDDLSAYLARVPDAADAEEVRGLLAQVSRRAATLN